MLQGCVYIFYSLGIHALFKYPGILNNAEERKLFSVSTVAEQTTAYHQSDEREMLNRYRQLPINDRAKLMAIADALKQVKEKSTLLASKKGNLNG